MRYSLGQGISEQSGRGRNPLLSDSARARALQLLARKECNTAGEVAARLHSEHATKQRVSRQTIARAARQEAESEGKELVVRRGCPRKELDAATKRLRLDFALANRGRNWSNVLFTDRKKFSFTYPGAKVRRSQWLLKGEKREAHMASHALAVNLYAGMCQFGTTEAHIVAGTSKHSTRFTTRRGQPARGITSAEYADVLNSTILPGGSKIFSMQGMGHWVLMQDNDTAHHCAAAVVQSFNGKRRSGVQLLGSWPPNSPDMNPIENLWAWVSAEVDAKGCKTFEQYKEAVLDQISTAPHSMLKQLVASMPRRMAQVIQEQGGRTTY